MIDIVSNISPQTDSNSRSILINAFTIAAMAKYEHSPQCSVHITIHTN